MSDATHPRQIRRGVSPGLCLLAAWFLILTYVCSQKPRVWCDRQWAGLALTRGGYRAWTLSFCDGETIIEGKWQPVVVETGGYRKGYFRWPKYRHVDFRGFTTSEP